VVACHGCDLHFRTGFRGGVYAPVTWQTKHSSWPVTDTHYEDLSFAAVLTLNFGLMPTGLERKFSQRWISES
jgi:hypothetical protein